MEEEIVNHKGKQYKQVETDNGDGTKTITFVLIEE